MKRAIVDYKKLTKEILSLLVEKYPEGYQDSDVIRFKNAKGETVEALEVRTDDTTYLVKVSTRLANTMERYDEDEEDDYYGEGTLEMSREDEIALRHKKDASKSSLQMELDGEDEDEDERDEYADESSEDYDEDDDEDDDDIAIASER
nr:DNA primase [uncultured Capnocytophaga sp.]